MLVPIPINRTTLNGLYGLDLDGEADAERLSRRPRRAGRRHPHLRGRGRLAGRPRALRTFFEGYTRKQWGLDPSELDKSVTARVPDAHQPRRPLLHRPLSGHAADGYTPHVREHARPPEHPHRAWRRLSRRRQRRLARRDDLHRPDRRVLRLTASASCPIAASTSGIETLDQEQFQPVGVVNYPASDVPYTRITEYKHLTGQSHPKTSIPYEYPAPRAIPTIRCHGPRTRRSTSSTRPGRGTTDDVDLRRAARHLPLLQHGPGRRPGARDLPPATESREPSSPALDAEAA